MSVEAIAPIAIIDSYEGLVSALRQRVSDLGTTLSAVDSVAGLPDAYTAKLLSGQRGVGAISFGPLLGALAVKLHVVPDADQLSKIRHRLPLRSSCGPRLVEPSRQRQARQLAAAILRMQREQRREAKAQVFVMTATAKPAPLGTP
jgi:hypothetical protein